MIQIWEGDGEEREGGRQQEGKKTLKIEFSLDLYFFYLFIGFGSLYCCILLGGLIKGSHVLIFRYIF